MKRARAGLVALGLSACAGPGAASHPAAPPSAQPARGAGVWTYEVVEEGGDLEVNASFPSGSGETFSLEDGATPFAADVRVRTTGEEAAGPAIEARGGIWTIPTCEAGCALDYRFHLATAARELRDLDSAVATAGCIGAPPSTWLLRPTDHPAGATYRFHVRAGQGRRFATGVHPVAGADDTYGAGADEIDYAPYSVFGPFRARTLAAAGASIESAILPGHLALDDAALDHWIDASARAIQAYYGKFPVPRFLLIVAPSRGGRGETVEGRTLASGGSSILLGPSSEMTAAETATDWVLTHEMTHLSFPSLERRYHWLEEGLATYVEPLARAKVGTLRPEEVWRGMVDGLPNGEPESGDEGLDVTHTWGRTYWGGALFSFMADLEIRKRTNNAKSLEDALRGILADGGSGEARWTLAETLKKGDEAIGVPVLEEMHAKWGTSPVTVDLERLWKELGVRRDGNGVTFDDAAPLATVRKAMTTGSR